MLKIKKKEMKNKAKKRGYTQNTEHLKKFKSYQNLMNKFPNVNEQFAHEPLRKLDQELSQNSERRL